MGKLFVKPVTPISKETYFKLLKLKCHCARAGHRDKAVVPFSPISMTHVDSAQCDQGSVP